MIGDAGPGVPAWSETDLLVEAPFFLAEVSLMRNFYVNI